MSNLHVCIIINYLFFYTMQKTVFLNLIEYNQVFGNEFKFWSQKVVALTYMELNMPIKAVKQKPIANIDFMRTYIYEQTKVKY